MASQRLRHLRVAQPGIVDAHHVAVAAQGLFQQAVDSLSVVLPRQNLAQQQMRKALANHLAKSLNPQAMSAEVWRPLSISTSPDRCAINPIIMPAVRPACC